VRSRGGLVDGQEVMNGTANATTTGGGRGVYDDMNLVLEFIFLLRDLLRMDQTKVCFD
jgi:hypothetical protein